MKRKPVTTMMKSRLIIRKQVATSLTESSFWRWFMVVGAGYVGLGSVAASTPYEALLAAALVVHPNGTLIGAGRRAKQKLDRERFLQYVEVVEGNGCWPWTGATDDGGYGVFMVEGRACGAHRVSFELFVGPIPTGKLILHSCDNPPCVRPDHLSPDTSLANNQDMIAKGRRVISQFWPDRSGSKNDNAKLTPTDVLAIRADTRSKKEIAVDYGITHGHVRHVQQGRAWKTAA